MRTLPNPTTSEGQRMSEDKVAAVFLACARGLGLTLSQSNLRSEQVRQFCEMTRDNMTEIGIHEDSSQRYMMEVIENYAAAVPETGGKDEAQSKKG